MSSSARLLRRKLHIDTETLVDMERTGFPRAIPYRDVPLFTEWMSRDIPLERRGQK